jgi:hypothetical protein
MVLLIFEKPHKRKSNSVKVPQAVGLLAMQRLERKEETV